MTREKAILHGKEQLEVFGGEHRAFIEMAIKALEQERKGYWIYNEGSYKCPFCGHEITGREEDLQYCCKCGAKNEHKE